MLNANTKARIALFNRAPKEDDKQDVVYPIMTGVIEGKDFQKNVSAFKKINTKNGKEFLSLVIRNENDEQTFSGTLHRDEKDGKQGHYFGYISEQFVDETNGETTYSNSEWQVGIRAKIQTPEGKKKYIGGDVYPLNKHATATTSNPDSDDDIAF